MNIINWNRTHRRLLTVITVTLGSVVSGCSIRTETEPVGVVSGRITIDGKPVDAGIVRFHDSFQGNIAGSPLAPPEGVYKLTFGGRNEIPTGNYIVTVSPPPPVEVDAVRESASRPQKAETSAVSAQIPKKYHSQQTSGLTANVTSGENKFDFELKSK